jgi:hypothetical protein
MLGGGRGSPQQIDLRTGFYQRSAAEALRDALQGSLQVDRYTVGLTDLARPLPASGASELRPAGSLRAWSSSVTCGPYSNTLEQRTNIDCKQMSLRQEEQVQLFFEIRFLGYVGRDGYGSWPTRLSPVDAGDTPRNASEGPILPRPRGLLSPPSSRDSAASPCPLHDLTHTADGRATSGCRCIRAFDELKVGTARGTGPGAATLIGGMSSTPMRQTSRRRRVTDSGHGFGRSPTPLADRCRAALPDPHDRRCSRSSTCWVSGAPLAGVDVSCKSGCARRASTVTVRPAVREQMFGRSVRAIQMSSRCSLRRSTSLGANLAAVTPASLDATSFGRWPSRANIPHYSQPLDLTPSLLQLGWRLAARRAGADQNPTRDPHSGPAA